MNKKIVEPIFPDVIEAMKRGVCPICSGVIGEFRDQLSVKEYKISGMCQSCQDKTFHD